MLEGIPDIDDSSNDSLLHSFSKSFIILGKDEVELFVITSDRWNGIIIKEDLEQLD